jgi:hypothetical protein
MEIMGLAVDTGPEFPFVISLAVNTDGYILCRHVSKEVAFYHSADDGENWTLVDNVLTNAYSLRSQ